MSKKATSQSSPRRPDSASDRDNPDQAAREYEGHPLRSIEAILDERLDQHAVRGERGPNLSGVVPGTSRAERDLPADQFAPFDDREPIDAES